MFGIVPRCSLVVNALERPEIGRRVLNLSETLSASSGVDRVTHAVQTSVATYAASTPGTATRRSGRRASVIRIMPEACAAAEKRIRMV